MLFVLIAYPYIWACVTGKNAPIQQIIDCGVVPYLIQFLQMDDNAALQLEAASSLNIIAACKTSDHRRYMVEAGVVPILIRLLSSTNEGVKSGAALILGNLVSDKDVKYRDIVLQAGALPALIQAAENKICDRIVFAISKLCHGKPFPNFNVIRPALPLLRSCLDSEKEKAVIYTCWALSCIAQRPTDCVDAILELNIMPRFIELLGGCTSLSIVKEVIIVLGQIASHSGICAQAILMALPSLLQLLDHPEKEIRGEVCFTLSKLTEGAKEQNAVIDAIFPKLIELLKSEDIEVPKRVVLAVCHAIKRGTSVQVWNLINEGGIPPLCRLLQVKDVETLTNVLEGLNRALSLNMYTETKFRILIRILSDCDVFKTLIPLQAHKDWMITNRSYEILKTLLRYQYSSKV